MQAARPLSLLIADDAALCRLLRPLLSGAGYDLEVAKTGQLALLVVRRTTPAVIILDFDLLDMDGQDLLKELRLLVDSPIVALSAHDDPNETITALDHGADDFLTKPFNSGELLARIRIATRHLSVGHSGTRLRGYAFGVARADLLPRRVLVLGTDVHLSPIEFKLLATLVRYTGKVLSHQFLHKEVSGLKQPQEPQTVRDPRAGLRRQMEADSACPCYLLTEQGVGYRLACENARGGKP